MSRNNNESHTQGHRQRLRQRFQKGGRKSLADYELLELLLTYSIPRKDTKSAAKAFLREYGSFNAVLDQPPGELDAVDGIGVQSATFLN